MIARLIRVEDTSQGSISVFLMDNEVFCWSLSPDAADPTKGHIPPGEYECRRFHGTKWPNTFEVLVPGHTAVLFHAGNVEADTQMCELLGSSVGKLKGNRAVLNSGATFKEFLERTKTLDGFRLIVKNCLG